MEQEKEPVLVGRKIRQIRERAGLTMEELASAAGMNYMEVYHVERGRRDVRLSTLEKIAAGLGITVSTLMRHARGPTPEEQAASGKPNRKKTPPQLAP